MKYLTTLGLLLLVSTTISSAQEEPPPEGWLHNVSGGYAYQGNGDLDGGGEFGVDHFSMQYGLSNLLPNGNVFGFSLGYDRKEFNFNGTNSLGQSDPWAKLSHIDLAAPIYYKMDNGWDLFAVPSLRASFENGADLEDGLTTGGLFGISRKFSDSFTFGPGFGLYSELEESVNFFPFLVINLKIDDSWSVGTGQGMGLNRGPAIYANYDLDKQLRFQFGGQYETSRFRLDDDGVAPDGVGEDRSFSFFGGMRYTPVRSIQFSAFTGVKFAGELTLDNRSGNRLSQQDYSSAYFGGITAKIYFQ